MNIYSHPCPRCGQSVIPYVLQPGFHTKVCPPCGWSGAIVSDEAESLREEVARLTALLQKKENADGEDQAG